MSATLTNKNHYTLNTRRYYVVIPKEELLNGECDVTLPNIYIKNVPIWYLTDIKMTDINKLLKPIKHSQSDILLYHWSDLLN